MPAGSFKDKECGVQQIVERDSTRPSGALTSCDSYGDECRVVCVLKPDLTITGLSSAPQKWARLRSV